MGTYCDKRKFCLYNGKDMIMSTPETKSVGTHGVPEAAVKVTTMKAATYCQRASMQSSRWALWLCLALLPALRPRLTFSASSSLRSSCEALWALILMIAMGPPACVGGRDQAAARPDFPPEPGGSSTPFDRNESGHRQNRVVAVGLVVGTIGKDLL